MRLIAWSIKKKLDKRQSIDSPIEKRLGGSIASVLYCLDQEVDVFRVHDVFETRQAIEVYKKISCLR